MIFYTYITTGKDAIITLYETGILAGHSLLLQVEPSLSLFYHKLVGLSGFLAILSEVSTGFSLVKSPAL